MAVVFDTSIFIAYKPSIDIHSSSYQLSAVVIQELMAGARDSSELKFWEAIAREFWKQDRLLIPTYEDWLLAGRVLNSLLRGLKSKRDGKTPKLHPDDKQRIIRDVLIARTVRRVSGLLVTDNLDDFKRIKKFCDVRLQSGKAFFGS
jgi:predicted nucleic acid-binding protein